ncbi:hypothetical protein M1271_00945 [Patescibacteria group bacterium]|nr:hypothetical protein [Patescibacteria group bacterium]
MSGSCVRQQDHGLGGDEEEMKFGTRANSEALPLPHLLFPLRFTQFPLPWI